MIGWLSAVLCAPLATSERGEARSVAPLDCLDSATLPLQFVTLEVGGVSVHLAALDLDQPFEEAARALNEAITRLLL
jgi:hypothetical protein